MPATGTQRTHIGTLTTLLDTIQATVVRSDDDQAAVFGACKRIRREIELLKSVTKSVR